MKYKAKPAVLAVALLLCTACAADDGATVNPDSPASVEFKTNAKTNAARISALAAETKVNPEIAFFAVPAMSDTMRLGDVYPEDGRFNGELRVIAALDEYEPASFQLFSMKDRKNVTFGVPDLKSKNGTVLPAKNLDLKVVKIWYQGGNRWVSYFQDVGLRLCPELLLKDENMIKVDTANVANYARIRKDGKDTYEWISAPYGLDAGFNAMQKGFEDAKEMQPVTLTANEFKQFFVTVHVPANQKPGVYSGTISVRENGKEITAIPMKVRVLPFALPMPATYQKLEMPVICSVMGGFGIARTRNEYKDEKLATAKYMELLANIKAHGVFHPSVDQTEENIKIAKDFGFPTDIWFGTNFMPWYARNFGGKLTFDNMMAAKAAAKKTADFYNKTLGHSDNILTSYGDEQGAAFVVCHRNFHKYFEEYGIQIGCAGHSALFYKGAHLYGIHPMGGDPDSADRIKRWRDMDRYIGFYACQHTGSENPAFIRRQNGMLGYMNGLNMLDNYEFAFGPWNDRVTECYKPMVIAYKNYGGLVDTLQWEGFREAVDDMRYCTLLQMEIKKGLVSKNVEYRTQARIAQMYLATLKPAEMELGGVRAEMIRFILKLQSMAQKKG